MQDKRVRVSADTSPLESLRRDVKAIWDDFNSMEKGFGVLASETVDILQKQIDLLKERNKLLSEESVIDRNYFRGRIDSSSQNNLGNYQREGITEFQINDPSQNRIISELVRIAEILEKGNRDEENRPPQRPFPEPDGEVPQPPERGRGDSGSLNNFRFPTMSSLINALPFGAAIYGIGQLIGRQAQFDASQYGAENRFQRENNLLNHWLLNAITFGISGAESQKLEIGRIAASRNDQILNRYASLHNYSYEQALQRQLRDSFGEDIRHIENIKDNNLSNSYMMSPDLNDIGSGGTFVYTGERKKAEEEAAQSGITPEEYHTWASRTLGLNVTEYLERVANLQRAGVYGRNTSIDDINQLLLAERIRGVSLEEMMPALRATRFSKNMTGSQVVRAFDSNLQGLGKDAQYISATLGEYISSFERTVERVLEKTGRVNTQSIVGAMTSIQNVTGAEGRRLERYQGALMGQDISQDDVTQALLMRTARRLNPDGNLSDLQAMIERMPEDTDLQKSFFKQIKTMTGGGEMMRHVMKAVFPTLSMNDIIDLEKATDNEADKIWGRMRTSGGRYSEDNARSKVGAAEMSTAGTSNRQIIDGYNDILEKQGSSLKEVLNKVYSDPIPVMIVKGQEKSNVEVQDSEPSQLVKILIQKQDEFLKVLKNGFIVEDN